MALLEIVSAWARQSHRRLLAITVDHGLSPGSADWLRRCEAASRALGADWILRRWDGHKPATGLPAAARRARHALIGDAAREAGAKVVMLAHTADDIAEADWMRARGSTLGRLREWSPSPAWPEGRGLMLLRPLLREGREDLRAVLRAAGRDWIEDPANADERFGRSRARKSLSLLPLGQGRERTETEGGRVFGAIPQIDPSSDQLAYRLALRAPGPLRLGVGFESGRSIDANMLAAVLLCAAGGDVPPRRDRLDRLIVRLGSGEDFTVTLSGARIQTNDERVSIGREPGEMRRRAPADVPLVLDRPAVWDGRYEVIAREPGWTVTAALGRLNALSTADRAIVGTVVAWGRAALPVLIRDGSPAPVLAWRQAEVRSLAPRRLGLALGETTQECDLYRTIHGETPPTDLF